MKPLYDKLAFQFSQKVTQAYSTSFSMGIKVLKPSIRSAIYAIYGYVRFADEIVDTFHNYPQNDLLNRFKQDTFQAINDKISLNPILQSFQQTVHTFAIDKTLIEQFLQSMAMDLQKITYNQQLYEQHILGSAEVVGLMCLKVFVEGNEALYHELKPYAMKLGSAFQKINFLRDLKEDTSLLGRVYFPNIQLSTFDAQAKKAIEAEINAEMEEAAVGIKKLPPSAKFGVYLAFSYYYALFTKIKNTPVEKILAQRVRIVNARKLLMLARSYFKFKIASL